MNDNAFSIVKGALPQKRQLSLSELNAEELLERSRVTPTTVLPPMEALFRMYDVPCFYRGELVAVCGKAKSGKTMFLSIVMATGNLRVLWFDTEQSQQSTQEIMVKRIMPLIRGTTNLTNIFTTTNLTNGTNDYRTTDDADDTDDFTTTTKTTNLTDDTDDAGGVDFDERFYAYNLRGLGYEKRREMMEVAIARTNPDLVIVDGIKDLMTDINDAVQATVIMEQLMALAQRHHCCIVCVLHQNKSEADKNMRGSIGTELTNKAFEVYTCEYLEERETFKVAQQLSRRDRIRQKLYYQLDDDRLPVCDEAQEQSGVSTTPKDVDLKALFRKAMEGKRQRPYGELMAVALKRCGVVDAKAYYAYVEEAERLGIIRKTAHPETGVTWVELEDNQLPF